MYTVVVVAAAAAVAAVIVIFMPLFGIKSDCQTVVLFFIFLILIHIHRAFNIWDVSFHDPQKVKGSQILMKRGRKKKTVRKNCIGIPNMWCFVLI